MRRTLVVVALLAFLAPPILAQSAAAPELPLPTLPLSFANRAAAFTIHDVRLVEAYESARSPLGGPLLVVELSAENVIPLTLVREQQLPTEYRMRDLGDHLYVVVNGNRVGRIAPNAERAEAHLPVRGFGLPELGDVLRGDVVFALPPEAVASLELRLYDFVHGHGAVTLVGDSAAAASESPLFPLAVNEIVEAGVYDLVVGAAVGERMAPPGTTFVSVELRARSMFTYEVDATAFDPQAERGDRAMVGTVADWLEALKYLHLVVDGEHAVTADPALTSLPQEPRFLPDVMTGGRAVFAVPEGFTSLRLRADFPNARMPDRTVIRPRAIQFALHGDEPPALERDALWSVRDDTLEVALVDSQPHASFASVDAASGRRFLVVDVQVRNVGERPEWFQTANQLRYVDARGRQHAPHALTFEGPRRSTSPHVWVPDGEQRSFQVVYQIDADERAPRVAFRGFTLAETVELPAIAD